MLLWLSASAALGSCGPGAATAGPGQEATRLPTGPVAFRILIPRAADEIPRDDGSHSGLPALNAVARSEAEWAALLDHLEWVPPLAVDFAVEMLLIAAAGRRGYYGHWLTIDSVRVVNDTVRVLVTEHVPPPRAPTLGMEVTPWTVVAIPRAANPVVFEERKIQY